MDAQVRTRIDAALAGCIEPQSLLSVLDLGLVSKVSYSERESKVRLELAIGTPRFECPACSAINGVALEGMRRRTREAVEAALPGWTVEIDPSGPRRA